ncbi:unnamed protein product [Trypanosoma congolense IL3000]|uniref:WGS project CAEQ00000000 data, annotated contig 568 n=1 Tax=Trypanosoma congolense (strain IL3000) TaxID=1068625 RepID=F9WGX8_TRYCI|nr:unnamed protein product [Trypanosoma congolense IL3000]
MHYRARTKTDSVLGANGYTTEVDGRDRVRYFRPPVEATGMPMRYVGMGNVRFSATADAPMTSRPDSHLALRRTGSAGTDMAWPVLRLPRLDCGGAVAAARSGNAKRAHRPSTVPRGLLSSQHPQCLWKESVTPPCRLSTVRTRLRLILTHQSTSSQKVVTQIHRYSVSASCTGMMDSRQAWRRSSLFSGCVAVDK